MRAVLLAAVGMGLVMTASAARAGDDDDQRTFSEKIVDGFYSTIRGSNMDNRGIDYRERSPLVVPPRLDLPPPAASSGEAKIANWPKDPDERTRKAIIAAKKKNAPPVARVQAAGDAGAPRPINIAPPVEEAPPPAPGTVRPTYANDNNGTAKTDPVYDQSGDLFKGGASSVLPSSVSDAFDIGNLFGSKKADANAALPPGTEPTREALTQPPSGYQTPSPNYPYGVAPKGILSGEANPDRNPRTQQSSASSMEK